MNSDIATPPERIGKLRLIGQACLMTDAKDDGTSPELTLPHLIKWVEMAVRAHAERALRGMAVSGSQLFALVLLRERGEATSAELARMMRLTPQAMTTLLRSLRDEGYIERRTDSAHGRRLLMQLTPKGCRILAQVHELTPSIEDDVLDGFTVDERITLKRLLARIARRFD
jgi:DNA-binding MarR family transcriptional regulator